MVATCSWTPPRSPQGIRGRIQESRRATVYPPADTPSAERMHAQPWLKIIARRGARFQVAIVAGAVASARRYGFVLAMPVLLASAVEAASSPRRLPFASVARNALRQGPSFVARPEFFSRNFLN